MWHGERVRGREVHGLFVIRLAETWVQRLGPPQTCVGIMEWTEKHQPQRWDAWTINPALSLTCCGLWECHFTSVALFLYLWNEDVDISTTHFQDCGGMTRMVLVWNRSKWCTNLSLHPHRYVHTASFILHSPKIHSKLQDTLCSHKNPQNQDWDSKCFPIRA